MERARQFPLKLPNNELMMAPELVKEKNPYATACREAMRGRGSDEPAWLQSLRENSFDQFERAGFPNIKQEEWKYTNVSPIAKGNFAPVLVSNGTELTGTNGLAPFIYQEARQSRLVFVNGMLRKELSSRETLPAGVVAMDLAAALRSSQYEAAIREHLEQYPYADDSGFSALNTALFPSGLFLKIPRGLSIE